MVKFLSIQHFKVLHQASSLRMFNYLVSQFHAAHCTQKVALMKQSDKLTVTFTTRGFAKLRAFAIFLREPLVPGASWI